METIDALLLPNAVLADTISVVLHGLPVAPWDCEKLRAHTTVLLDTSKFVDISIGLAVSPDEVSKNFFSHALYFLPKEGIVVKYTPFRKRQDITVGDFVSTHSKFCLRYNGNI